MTAWLAISPAAQSRWLACTAVSRWHRYCYRSDCRQQSYQYSLSSLDKIGRHWTIGGDWSRWEVLVYWVTSLFGYSDDLALQPVLFQRNDVKSGEWWSNREGGRGGMGIRRLCWVTNMDWVVRMVERQERQKTGRGDRVRLHGKGKIGIIVLRQWWIILRRRQWMLRHLGASYNKWAILNRESCGRDKGIGWENRSCNNMIERQAKSISLSHAGRYSTTHSHGRPSIVRVVTST